jgi:hypothetical protein
MSPRSTVTRAACAGGSSLINVAWRPASEMSSDARTSAIRCKSGCDSTSRRTNSRPTKPVAPVTNAVSDGSFIRASSWVQFT